MALVIRSSICLSFLLMSKIGFSFELPLPITPPENPLTEEKRLLGKILFWDEQLSSDNTVACGSCHMPAAGGADPRFASHPGPDQIMLTGDDLVGSFGIVLRDEFNQPIVSDIFDVLPQVTDRASPSFFGGIFSDTQFWDGRAGQQFFDPLNTEQLLLSDNASLENQALGPILSSTEMAHQDRSWQQVTDKLSRVKPLALATDIPQDVINSLAINTDYPSLFAAAFGDPAVTPARIAMAIASYERSLVPDRSPWDLYVAGDESAMTENQIEGWELWEQQTVCDNCHQPPLFTDNQFYNIGLRPADEDIGRQQVTSNEDDFGRFKTPTLRNSGLKTSLMHVGWITDMQDAVDFYNAETNETGHQQFTENQSGIPTANGGFVEYSGLSMFGVSAVTQAKVIDFMANALTDPRVASETFPFDRPLLKSERIVDKSESASLKILSYNISSAAWTTVRADQVLEVIQEIDADVIGIQEALANQQEDLQDSLQTSYDFYGFNSDSFDPILVKKGLFKLITSGSKETTNCGGARYINYVILEDLQTEHWMAFYNAHFCATVNGQNIEENQAQAVELIELIAANQLVWPASIISVGDFNANISSDTIQFLIEQQNLPNGSNNPIFLSDSWQTVFGNNIRPTPIDWILHAPYSVKINDTAVFENELTSIASDHLPLTAIVQLSTAYIDTTANDDGADDGDSGTDEITAPNDEIASDSGGGGGLSIFFSLLLVCVFVQRALNKLHL